MKKYFAFIMIFVLIFSNPVKVYASDDVSTLPSYSSYIKGNDYIMIQFTNSKGYSTYILVINPGKVIENNKPDGFGTGGTIHSIVAYKSSEQKELLTYNTFTGYTSWTERTWSNQFTELAWSMYNETVKILFTTVNIYDENDNVIKEPTDKVVDSIDIGYTNYNDTVTSNNSVYDPNIPYIKNFKVIKTKGPGALAQHNLTWLSSEDLKQMRVEVALAYKVEASDSWFLNKKYNEGFAYYRTYADGLMSAREILNVPLSTSSPDGSFKDSVTTCIVGDLKSKFGDKEAMAIINATESNLKAYYIRNVVFKDGKYHYSQWVRCKVGSSYSVGHGGVVDENGMKYEDKEDYPVDPNGNPEYDADGGRGESGFAILDFLYGVFDSITGIFIAFVDGVGIVMEGVGKLPTAFGTIFGALPEPVSVVFVMGMMICVFMRFLKR